MPDLLAHYALSTLVAKTRFNTKKALLLGFIGLIPDIDVLIGLHRWIIHSLIVISPVAGIALLLIYKCNKRFLTLASITTLLIIPHVILDVFTAPTPILWPLSNQAYMVDIKLNGALLGDSVNLIPQTTLITREIDFTPRYNIEGPIISEIGVAAAITFVVIILVEFSMKHIGLKKQ